MLYNSTGNHNDVEYRYNRSNRFILKQGITKTNETIVYMGIPMNGSVYNPNGILKSVKKIK